ncbi:hypothetical protein ABQF26_04645 [Mycolicibacterium elephantis]
MQSAFAKLARAKVHLDQLDTDVKAFRAREPHDWTLSAVDHLFDPSLAVVKVHVRVKEQTPDTWPLIVGDVLTNLRAALDHAVYGHASSRRALTPAQEKSLNYPIITIATDWPNHRNRLAQFLDTNVLNVIEDSQPFKAGDPNWHSLALLNNLVNEDKHRAVRTVSYISEHLDVPSSDLQIVRRDVPSVEMTEGALVASLTVRRAEGDPGDKPGFPGWSAKHFHVVNGFIEKIELPKVNDARPLLQVMETLVADVESLLHDLKTAGC